MRMPSWWPINPWPLCSHRWKLARVVHGDERLYAYAWWECVRCGVQRCTWDDNAPGRRWTSEA